MARMVRIRSQHISLQKHRPPKPVCRKAPSFSLLFFTVGLASLGFFLLTEIGMMQRRSVTSPARTLFKVNQPMSSAGSLKKGTHTPPNQADNFKIEPLLRRNSPSVELSAQMEVNSLSAQRIRKDLKDYYNYVRCRGGEHLTQNSTQCANFTMQIGKIQKWWYEKHYCPAYPANLLPPREINRRVTIRLSNLDSSMVPGVQPGGMWIPPTCLALHSVAIVIPYRDRWRHLSTLMNHLHPLLHRQLIRYRIYVVEQYGNETFNKGTIMNAAFLEALRDEIYHCFIFHDVDLIPETDYNMYSCPQMPRHMSVAVNELHYRLPYHVLVGGVLAMKTEHFFKVNGYSNLFWGWGGEDDDMGMRIQQSGLYITRPVPEVGRYTMIKHVKRNGIEHRVRFKLVRTAKRRYRLDGLNTVQYRLLSKTESQWFTTLLVDLGSPPPGLRSV